MLLRVSERVRVLRRPVRDGEGLGAVGVSCRASQTGKVIFPPALSLSHLAINTKIFHGLSLEGAKEQQLVVAFALDLSPPANLCVPVRPLRLNGGSLSSLIFSKGDL